MSSQLSAHESKTFLCGRCLHYFRTVEKSHTIDCEKMNQCNILLPTNKKDSVLEFKNHTNKNRVPYVVYADFECLLQPVKDNERTYQHHEAFSVSFFVKCSYDDSQSEYKCYKQNSEQDEPPAKWFFRKLKDLALRLQGLYENPRPMRDLTATEQVEFARAQVCHICRKPFRR